MRRLALAALLWAPACSVSIDGGTCAIDSDCDTDQTCLFDLDRDTAYCTAFCETDDDCPPSQTCKTGKRGVVTEASELMYCVDRVRACSETELCNGFDDDCDGVVDEEGCQVVTGCLDDAACDAWTCQAPGNQPMTLCAPPNESATVDEFGRCTDDGQCRSGLCDTGLCAPLCRPGTACPSIVVDGETEEMFCAGAVGPGPTRPKHNACQIVCTSDNDCFDGQACVWRQVFQAEPQHAFVCSTVNPDLLPLGAPCPNNEPDGGDAMCQHGLCFQQRCTRPCGGPGSSCSDVDAAVSCANKMLFYGRLEFAGFICATP